MSFPIFVASKARPRQSKLLAMLESSSAKWFYVVEPQDRAVYLANIPTENLLVLPKNDQGLWYVRQWILDYAKANGIPWYWNLDDDITSFYRNSANGNAQATLEEALSESEVFILKHKKHIGQASLEYKQFAWSQKKRYVWNSYCDVCVAVNSKVSAKFRSETGLKVDRDFTLQILSTGFLTMKVCKYSCAAPKNGSNEGGLRSEYISGREARDSRTMARLWPTACKLVTKKDGRPDVKINWKAFQA